MNKKKLIVCLSLIVVVILGLFIIFKVFKKSDEHYIKNSDNLYDIAIDYLIKNNNDSTKNKSHYKLFIFPKKFAITEDKENKYAYMHICVQSYYVKDNKIISYLGSSMLYKFTFDKKTNKVIEYENPVDGYENNASIRRMFPDDIEDEAIKFKFDDKELIKEVKEYYSFLEDTNIYYK